MKRNLTAAVLAYKKGKESQHSAVNKVALYSYKFLKKKYKKQEDAASEIFCEILRRIPRIIELFSFRGTPFEAYLHISIKKATYSYFNKLNKKESLEKYALDCYYDDVELSSPSADSDLIRSCASEKSINYFELGPDKKIVQPHLRRRLLCLACKNAYFISQELIEKTADISGVSVVWLQETIGRLRKTMMNRLHRHTILSGMRKEYLARAYLSSQEDHTALPETLRQKYRNRYNCTSARIQKMGMLLRQVPLSPTHSEIAKALNIPKGSVDSGLHYLRNIHIAAADEIKRKTRKLPGKSNFS